MNKARKKNSLRNLQKYRKIMVSMSHQIFEADLEKKNRDKRTNFIIGTKEEKKKRKKRNFAKLYSLS